MPTPAEVERSNRWRAQHGLPPLTEQQWRVLEAERRKHGPPVGRPFDLTEVDPERLAAEVVRRGLGGEHAAEVAEDQSVYLYNGSVMIGHYPPSTYWVPVETPTGMALQVFLWSATQKTFVHGPRAEPGEWTYCGRGHPGR